MKNFKKPITALFIIILLVSISIIFRSILMVYIVEPIALLFWAIWRIASSVHQNIYWIILIALCIIFTTRQLSFVVRKTSKLSYTYSYKSPTQVDYWRILIKDSILGKNEDEWLRKHLKELLKTVISQSEGVSAMEVEKIVENRMTPLSPSAHQYLFSSNMKGKFFQKNTLNTLYFLPRWLRKRVRNFVHQNYSIIDEILDYTETELEINDEK